MTFSAPADKGVNYLKLFSRSVSWTPGESYPASRNIEGYYTEGALFSPCHSKFIMLESRLCPNPIVALDDVVVSFGFMFIVSLLSSNPDIHITVKASSKSGPEPISNL